MENFDWTVFILNVVKYSTFGVTVEVVFTAIYDWIAVKRQGKKPSWSLQGTSYVWMLPIYGSIALFAPIIFPVMAPYPFYIRLPLYGLLILAVEYVTGMALKKFIGRCPWHYTSRFAIHNVIRLDYYPLWMFFAYLVEWLYYNY